MVLVNLVPRQDYSHLLKNCVWSTTYSIFVQVGQNAGTLFFSNLTLDIIEDCIISTLCTSNLLAVWIVNEQS